MIVQKTEFNGLLVLEPKAFVDSRGFFMEAYNKKVFKDATGWQGDFVQDNHSRSYRGVLRGLHFQNAPYAQTKLVRVLSGSILDVAVDLRNGEPTYGKFYAGELSAENRKQILIPKGFAHGFAVLSEFADVLYKCDEYYASAAEGGINFLDADLDIAKMLPAGEFKLSDKDRALPFYREAKFNFD